METFSYHCPSCGSPLKLNVFSQKLMCESCGNSYNPATLAKDNQITTPDTSNAPDQQKIVRNFVEMNLYHCGSCGSEVITNDVEVTKICSFCGQSAIIYDRVAEIDRPDLIIPFKISKDDAIDNIKKKYAKAKYLTEEFNSLSIDSVYAIYVPYYVFGAELSASGHVIIPDKNGRSHSKAFSGNLKHHVFFDSSKKLNDAVSVYLNPFPYEQAVPFEPTYLSGFYADLGDVDSDRLSSKVKDYMWEILGEQLMNETPGLPSREIRQQNAEVYNRTLGGGSVRYYEPIIDKSEFNIESTESILCPIYFVTFNTSKGLCNILVNGCTGKVVGSIPASDELIKKSLIRNSIIFSLILSPIFCFAFIYAPLLWIGGIAAILSISAIFAAVTAKNNYNRITREMNTSSMFNLRRN